MLKILAAAALLVASTLSVARTAPVEAAPACAPVYVAPYTPFVLEPGANMLQAAFVSAPVPLWCGVSVTASGPVNAQILFSGPTFAMLYLTNAGSTPVTVTSFSALAAP